MNVPPFQNVCPGACVRGCVHVPHPLSVTVLNFQHFPTFPPFMKPAHIAPFWREIASDFSIFICRIRVRMHANVKVSFRVSVNDKWGNWSNDCIDPC